MHIDLDLDLDLDLQIRSKSRSRSSISRSRSRSNSGKTSIPKCKAGLVRLATLIRVMPSGVGQVYRGIQGGSPPPLPVSEVSWIGRGSLGIESKNSLILCALVWKSFPNSFKTNQNRSESSNFNQSTSTRTLAQIS